MPEKKPGKVQELKTEVNALAVHVEHLQDSLRGMMLALSSMEDILVEQQAVPEGALLLKIKENVAKAAAEAGTLTVGAGFGDDVPDPVADSDDAGDADGDKDAEEGSE